MKEITIGALPVNPNRPTLLRHGAGRHVGVLAGMPFIMVAPAYAFTSRRGWEQVIDGSRLLAQGSHVEIIRAINVPRAGNQNLPGFPSSSEPGGATFRVYQIHFAGPSVSSNFRQQFHGVVNGLVDAALVRG